MKFLRSLHLTTEMAVRLVADAVMVSTALLLGLILWLFWVVEKDGITLSRESIGESLQPYATSALCLVPMSLSVFLLSGFYTRGRAYQERYKALLIAHAVSLSYLVFGFLAFLLPDFIALPYDALFLAWIFTLVFLISARVWSVMWATVVRVEDRLYGRDAGDDKIKNVLVIGGAGYIGSALLPKLLNKGYHVRLLDLLLFGTEPIAEAIGHSRLEIVQADCREVGMVVEAMRGMDAVIHLGAIVGDPACALDEELTIEVNLMATRMVAEVAKSSGINRFIFASTCSVYGASDETLDERSALNPVSLYARSKIASEKVLMSMSDGSFAPVILRFATIYGLSGRTRFDLVVNLLAAKAAVDGAITVFSGDQWRPFVHVDDAALAILKALEAPRCVVHNRVFNVGSNDQNYTIQQIGELVHAVVPEAKLINEGADGDRRNYRVNFSKIRNTLDFVPRWTLEQGVQQVIEAIESGKVQDYRDARYSNVKYLSEEHTSCLVRRQNGWAYQLINETSPGVVAPAPPSGGIQPFPVAPARTEEVNGKRIADVPAYNVVPDGPSGHFLA